MKKSIQYIIAFSCLLVAGSVAYYFVSYIPEKNLQSLEKDCYKIAMDRYEEDKKFKLPEDSLPTEPQFSLDQENKRCLYKTMYFSYKGGDSDFYATYSIIDLQRNMELYGYSSVTRKDGETVLNGDKTEFQKMDKKFFSK
jgi:hypothetical protein